MQLELLTIFPVKSCAPFVVSRFRCTDSGPEWDREWMIVDENRRFLTQRELPRMALIQPLLDLKGGMLSLSAASVSGGAEIPINKTGMAVEVNIWDQPTAATDEGDAAARWLTDMLQREARLVRITKKNRFRDSGGEARHVRFVDSYPLHLCSLSSLADLNSRLPAPIEILRFRANLVLAGSEPWAEDNWSAVEIGGNIFRIGKRCERCTITTVDPATAERGTEPLRTLAGFRRNAKNKIEFGQYLHTVPGAEIVQGMEVKFH